jgi:hypothetical protein
MGRDSGLEDKEGRTERPGHLPETGEIQDRHAYCQSGRMSDERVVRFGPMVACIMTTRPRRSGSKGIRIYYHYKRYGGKNWERTRESHNYFTGLDAVRDLMKDKTVQVVGVGSEGGAMCLHYRRLW